MHHGAVQIDPDALPDDPAVLRQMLRELHAENDKLRLLIHRLTRHRFGRRSEQLTAEQLQLGLEDLEQSAAENQAAHEAAEPTGHRKPEPRADRPARNHGALPAHLPRYEVVIDVEPAPCPCCGGALHRIGEVSSEQLDMVPRSCACASRAARATRAAPARASSWPPMPRHGRSTAACRPKP